MRYFLVIVAMLFSWKVMAQTNTTSSTVTGTNTVTSKSPSTANARLNLSVASVAILAQDPRVHAAMIAAGTYPPIDGKIGDAARILWEQYPERAPGYDGKKQSYAQGEEITDEEIGVGLFSLGSLLWLLLL